VAISTQFAGNNVKRAALVSLFGLMLPFLRHPTNGGASRRLAVNDRGSDLKGGATGVIDGRERGAIILRSNRLEKLRSGILAKYFEKSLHGLFCPAPLFHSRTFSAAR
jgi:hypothetical protein